MDTVAAIATAPITAAVSLIRISGEGALSVAEKIFFPFSGKPLSASPRTAVYGRVEKDGQLLDRALCTYFAAPASYTGEDCVELCCHGGRALTELILSIIYEAGARPAGPGEFTKRAYLNGKLDLAEAEAVGDLISARSVGAVKNAAGQLSGRLSREVAAIADGLTDLCAHLSAWTDYADEGVEPPDMSDVGSRLSRIRGELSRLEGSFSQGRLYSEGVRIAVAGSPNVGKSSLLNALAGYERAIVSDVAGTTRDTLEVNADILGLPVTLTDTAGLRDTEDSIERLGIDRAKREIETSSLVLQLLDGSLPLGKDDLYASELARDCGLPVVTAVNKSDLPPAFPLSEGYIAISCATGEGLEELKRAVKDALGASAEPDGSLVSNRRQAAALRLSGQHLDSAMSALSSGYTPDLVWIDTEAALRALEEITGRTASEDVLNRVFEKFCVGK